MDNLQRTSTPFVQQSVLPLAGPVSFSIVVPTRNESGNIATLLKRVGAACKSQCSEIIFVDDSTDNTPEVIRKLADQETEIQVRLIARPPERRNGLGKAVVEGLKAAQNDYVVVMDGDLQHPPEVITGLFDRIQKQNLDVMIASRLAPGGSTDGLSLYRKFISYSLAVVSHIVFPQSLHNVSDPMTGFFLVNRRQLNLDQLEPNGFKILLEILCKHPKLKVDEMPFEFGERLSGESKANSSEMLLLFKQIFRLRFAAVAPVLQFLVVGLTGLVVNTALMALFTEYLQIHYLVSALLATQGSTLWNFLWTEKWVFKQRTGLQAPLVQRISVFFVINNILLALRSPLLAAMVSGLAVHYVVANVSTLMFMTVLRYLLADNLIWRTERTTTTMPKAKLWYYDIHGIMKVRSEQRLPELKYFLTDKPVENPDIDVMIAMNPTAHKEKDSIVYEEMFKALGFSIVINRSDTVSKVYASQLVKFSPHVLYTNVVEPLMRWGLVRKGYALMHGASISFEGQSLFITAQTDTGKTTTILYTLQHNPGEALFLSDDMTIFSENGQVFNYPKPLTISQHTLQAVGAAPLPLKKRLFLKVQSRLHSRGGRRVGMAMSENGFPAATLSAIVQAFVPPPKYMVDELVPGTEYAKSAQLAHIVLIERGPDMETNINDLDKANILVANAEDAYGFPPYPAIADQLSNWKGSDLHKAERVVVESAIENITATHLRSSSYGWYKRLPYLVKQMQTKPIMSDQDLNRLFRPALTEQDVKYTESGD
ncbi:MAG: glycosyltransferase family 2 protein [Chloroflexi bacterium]|nr:glycosyltransferase family 2 protein [Chloroflexota bacterium]